MNKVLVTGGCGFIGSHLVPLLLERGYAVTVFDNFSTGKLDNLGTFSRHSNLSIVRGDIREGADLHEALKGVEDVVHLAALIDVAASVVDPIGTHEVNVTGTLNVLNEAAKSGVRRVVFASSTAVYGHAVSLPVGESSVLQPISPYAASKASGEAYCSAFSRCFGLETVMLRFFNVYGPRNENSPYSGVITKFLRAASEGRSLDVYGDGEQTRDFIYVSDVARALVLALEKRGLHDDIFNICTGVQTSINGLIDALRSVFGKDLAISYSLVREGDIKYSYGDPSKAAEGLGFRSRVRIEAGLRLLLKEYGK